MNKKRKLFDELMEGADAIQQQREARFDLRRHEVAELPLLERMQTLTELRGSVCRLDVLSLHIT